MPDNDPASAALPSSLHLPAGPWLTVLDCLCERFPRIPREHWLDRFARGRVLDERGHALRADAPHRAGLYVRYFREVEAEPRIDCVETLVHVDEHLVVVDKPAFLPIAPTGPWVRETLHARLVARLGNPDLVPLHRLDRLTSGLVLFGANPATRARYQALFRERRIAKAYRALARPLPHLEFPLERRSRLERGEPFFTMREAPGAPNAITRIDVRARHVRMPGDPYAAEWWEYGLEPVTGRKHQLRVHLAALGAPIANDPLYPRLADPVADALDRPLQLLACSLAFRDPLDGRPRRFECARGLPLGASAQRCGSDPR